MCVDTSWPVYRSKKSASVIPMPMCVDTSGVGSLPIVELYWIHWTTCSTPDIYICATACNSSRWLHMQHDHPLVLKSSIMTAPSSINHPRGNFVWIHRTSTFFRSRYLPLESSPFVLNSILNQSSEVPNRPSYILVQLRKHFDHLIG